MSLTIVNDYQIRGRAMVEASDLAELVIARLNQSFDGLSDKQKSHPIANAMLRAAREAAQEIAVKHLTEEFGSFAGT